MTANKFYAKLDLPPGMTLPSDYDADRESRPSDDFVISRHRDDSVASRYGDFKWDISAWQTEGRLTVLYFNFWKTSDIDARRELLTREARWLMFSLIWLRDGASFSTGTLMNYMFTIRALALFSDSRSCPIQDVLANEDALLEFAEDHCSAGRQKTLSSLLFNLERVGTELLGFSIVGDRFQQRLRAHVRRSNYEAKQTPPIPTRIYSQILSSLFIELNDWENVESEFLALLRRCAADPVCGRRARSQSALVRLEKSEKGLQPTWAEIAPPNVRAYLREKGQNDDVSGLGSTVTQVQLVCKLTIQAYSGMRDDEALSLPFDSLDVSECDGRARRLIKGRTTKFSKGPRSVRWVTNKEGQRAIEIAQRIAEAIFSADGRSAPLASTAATEMPTQPLFVSSAYFSLGGRRRARPSDGHFVVGCLSLARFHRMRVRLQPIIEPADLSELEQIDEHRAWRAERCFELGRPWALETHQLRRSLAMYAQRSGLVTLPSLRRQLQHITDEMTRYYANGSLYAKDLFCDALPNSGHFCFEWQATHVESAALSYACHVLFTDDQLFGGHAAFVLHQLKKGAGCVSAETRAETVKMFKRGQLHYRETMLGGCTRHDACDSPALDWLNLDCIANNCSNMVGSLAKLDAVIAEQERLVLSLPSSSLLFRTESMNLEVLIKARDRARLAWAGGNQ